MCVYNVYMRKKFLMIVLAMLVLIAGGVLWWLIDSRPEKQDSDSSPVDPLVVKKELFEDYYEQAEQKLANMTLEEKVGQMFLVRFDEDKILDEIVSGVGGYILFAKDFVRETPETMRTKLSEYQNLSKLGLIFGADEEGGTVTRVSRYAAFRSEKFPSPQDLWKAGGMAAILDDTTEKTTLLKGIGLNMNLAPVADVSMNAEDFMNARSFGRDAKATAEYVATVVERMRQEGMISVMKHFPGYGNNVDTHTGIAIDNRDYESFVQEDFLPFVAGIEAGGPCILVSHNIVKAMDETKPASLSPLVHQVLRHGLDFSGVIITDDLAMGAIKEYTDNGSAAVLAVLAGNDLIITSDFEQQKQEVLQAVQDGKIPEATIDMAVRRILALKYQYGLISK